MSSITHNSDMRSQLVANLEQCVDMLYKNEYTDKEIFHMYPISQGWQQKVFFNNSDHDVVSLLYLGYYVENLYETTY